MSLFVLLLLSLSSVAQAWQPDFILRLTNTTVYSDCTPRESIVINGTSPGPLIRLTEGEHYWIRVYNDIPDQNTTIHFHGFTQYLSPFSDGTPLGSGWPIPPGHFYDYEFKLGTYWYHSHVSMQDMTAYGPIIIDPPAGQDDGCPVAYDEDLVMLTSDYYHATQEQLVANLLNKTAFHWVGDPQSLLVNGHAPFKCNASTLAPGQVCADPTSCGVSQMFVKPNTRYRVRVIATGALSYLQMALEGHNMTVFEVDGTYIEPIPIADLQIQIGQRYSVLIETMANPPKQDYYWRFRSMWRPSRTNGAAMWTYRDDANCDPLQTTKSNLTVPATLNTTVYLANETFGWIDGQFKQYNQSEYPPKDSEVTRRIWLDNKQITWDGNNQTLRWSVNMRLYNESIPTTPILLNMYETGKLNPPNYTAAENNGGYDESTMTYPVKLGEVLDIIIQMVPGETTNLVEAHPWHSHGKKYWDMGIGMGNFSYEALAQTLANRTGTPFQRDTSVAYPGPGASYIGQKVPAGTPGGWRLLRIKVTDPGLWLVHCHITMHQIMGMMVPLLYGAENLPPIPESLTQEYLTFGGGAFGQPIYDYTGEEVTDYTPTSYFKAIGK